MLINLLANNSIRTPVVDMKYFGLICLLTIGSSAQEFAFWDYCEQVTTDCELPYASGSGIERLGSGSAYEIGSSEWYLLGGIVNYTITYTDTVAVIGIPSATTGGSLTGYTCSETYAFDLPRRMTESAGSVINGELYSFGGAVDDDFALWLNESYNSDTSPPSAFGIVHMFMLILTPSSPQYVTK